MATGIVARSSVGMATTSTLSASSGAWSGKTTATAPRATELIVQSPASPLRPNQRAASRNGSIRRTSANDRGGRPAKAITPRTMTASAIVLAAANLDRRPWRAWAARPVRTARRTRTPAAANASGMTISRPSSLPSVGR
jgi:hypothetical protein